jgi:hypothetical protein
MADLDAVQDRRPVLHRDTFVRRHHAHRYPIHRITDLVRLDALEVAVMDVSRYFARVFGGLDQRGGRGM